MYYICTASAPGVAGAAGGGARESAIPAPRDDCECGYATTAMTATIDELLVHEFSFLWQFSNSFHLWYLHLVDDVVVVR